MGMELALLDSLAHGVLGEGPMITFLKKPRGRKYEALPDGIKLVK